MGPWEEFQQQTAGPWTDFQGAPPSEPSPAPSKEDWLSEMHREGKKALSDAVTSATTPGDLAKDGLIGSQLRTGGALLSAAAAPFAYPFGAAQAGLSRLMSEGLRATGDVVEHFGGPKNKTTSDEIYDMVKDDVGLALSATGARAKIPAMSSKKMLEEAGKSYDLIRQSATNQTPMHLGEFQFLAGRARMDIDQGGFRRSVAPNTHKALDELADAMGNATPDMTELVTAREKFRHIGGTLKDKEAARGVIDWIDRKLSVVSPGVMPILQETDKAYHIGKLSSGVEEVARDSLLSGKRRRNIGEETKTQFTKFEKDQENLYGLTGAEKEAVKDLGEGTKTGNLLRVIGRMDPTSNQFAAFFQMGAAPLSGGASTVLAGIGYAARKLSDTLAVKQAKKLSDMIRERSPYVRRVTGPMAEWGETARAFESDPTPKNFARLSLASKNLSTNLSDFGIKLSPTELLKSLQGAAPARSEDEE